MCQAALRIILWGYLKQRRRQNRHNWCEKVTGTRSEEEPGHGKNGPNEIELDDISGAGPGHAQDCICKLD